MTKVNFRSLFVSGSARYHGEVLHPLVLEALGGLRPSDLISTGDIATKLWPVRDRTEPGDKLLYGKLCRVLSALGGRDLSHCCRLGEAKQLYGKEARPLVWHRPSHQTAATAHPGGSSTPSPRPPHPDVLPPQFQAFINKAIRLAADMTDDDELMSPVLAKAVNDLADVAEALFDAHLAAEKLAQAGEVAQ